MNVPINIQEQIDDRIQWCLAKAEEQWGLDLKFPTVLYTKRGRIAATANHGKWEININPILLMENLDDMIRNTVPHEVAHLVADRLDILKGTLFSRKPHGWRWQSVMLTFGLAPERCHKYDTTNAAVHKSSSRKHVYKCITCSREMKLGNKRHSNMQSGLRKYYMRGCKFHGGFKYVGVEGGAVQPKNTTSTAAAAFLASGRTKKDESFRIYQEDKHLGRKAVITRFKNELDMSDAGASTYYQNAKKFYGD